MLKNLLAGVAAFFFWSAQALELNFNPSGVAIATVNTTFQGGSTESLVFDFSIPNIDGVTLSAQVFRPYSDVILYGSLITGATVQGAGSYVFATSPQNFLTLSQAYLPQGDWKLIVDVVTQTLGGSVTVFLSATPSPFVGEVPEAGRLPLTLAGLAAVLLIARRRFRR